MVTNTKIWEHPNQWNNFTRMNEWWMSKELDKKFEKENRKVILIIDNCPAHPIIECLEAVELVSLPPNTTSKTQPMDQGVIRSLKAKDRKKIIQTSIRAVDIKKPFPKTSILDAMQWLTFPWSEVSEATIKYCFRKVGILEKSAEAIDEKTLHLKNFKKPSMSFVKDFPINPRGAKCSCFVRYLS